MNYLDVSFLFLLAIAASLYRICPLRFRPVFLLVASYAFYLTWSIPGALLMAAVTTLTWIAARRHARLGPLIAILLAAYLMAFKVALLTPSHGIAGLIMPLGISFYSFKLISYVLDVHWGKLEPSRSLVNFAAYVAFFPQIVAGPIQRPDDFFSQLPPVPSPVSEALPRIAWGFIKKLLIADNLGHTVDYVYAHVTALHGAPLWVAFYLYPLQLYADFSGLTDIAIGTGRLFGINAPENFNRPFTATSISDYWRRWHMSLTTWLTDYVFMPLRMAARQAGNFGLVFSITVNMVAIGLWHGLTASFLAFGLIHSVYLSVDALTNRTRSKWFKRHPEWNSAGSWLGWLLTLHLVAIGLVFFRSTHISDAVWLLGSLFSGSGSVVIPWLGLVGYVILELGERFRPDRWLVLAPQAPRWVRWSVYASSVVLVIFGISLLLVHTGASHSPFIYEIF